jgi:hypothetical protein
MLNRIKSVLKINEWLYKCKYFGKTVKNGDGSIIPNSDTVAFFNWKNGSMFPQGWKRSTSCTEMAIDFKGDKNPQHAFIRRGSKAVRSCLKILHVESSLEVFTKILRKTKFLIYLSSSSCFATRWLIIGLQESSGGRIRFSPGDFIPPWFSMLICHLRNEYYSRWWPQFRDIDSPHRHEHQIGNSIISVCT